LFLYWRQQDVEILLPSGKRNPAASVILVLLVVMTQNEMTSKGGAGSTMENHLIL
jgi:hypothetical protein